MSSTPPAAGGEFFYPNPYPNCTDYWWHGIVWLLAGAGERTLHRPPVEKKTLAPAPVVIDYTVCWRSRFTLRASEAAAQCIVIVPVCLLVYVFVGRTVGYHDNSKLRASILTKLGLSVKVLTISSCLNFGLPTPSGSGSAVERNFCLPPYYSQHAVFASHRSTFFTWHGWLGNMNGIWRVKRPAVFMPKGFALDLLLRDWA